MHADTEQVIERPSDLTASWLTAAIGAGPVADFAVERIGTGQMSECYRIRLSYADADCTGPETVVLKVAASDPVVPAFAAGSPAAPARRIPLRFALELPVGSCRM